MSLTDYYNHIGFIAQLAFALINLFFVVTDTAAIHALNTGLFILHLTIAAHYLRKLNLHHLNANQQP